MMRLSIILGQITGERRGVRMILAVGLIWCLCIAVIPQANGLGKGQDGVGRKAGEQSTTGGGESSSPIDELIKWYERAQEQLQSLRGEAAQLRMQLKQATRERDELKLFIADHDQYGSDFAKYNVFKAQRTQADVAKKAAAAKAKREERKRRIQELRKKRTAARNGGGIAGNPLSGRVKLLQQAGYTPIGDSVLVGQMGYVYKTETQNDYLYSPYFNYWYYDDSETVDYRNLTLSGSIIHAAERAQDISIAIAFYDEHGGQIGQTTVRVEGARPGVPYPFTAEVAMAADEAFDNYTAWVLYAEPSDLGGDAASDKAGGGNGAGGNNLGGNGADTGGGNSGGGQTGQGGNGDGNLQEPGLADGIGGTGG